MPSPPPDHPRRRTGPVRISAAGPVRPAALSDLLHQFKQRPHDRRRFPVLCNQGVLFLRLSPHSQARHLRASRHTRRLPRQLAVRLPRLSPSALIFGWRMRMRSRMRTGKRWPHPWALRTGQRWPHLWAEVQSLDRSSWFSPICAYPTSAPSQSWPLAQPSLCPSYSLSDP